ncbi:MAG: AzlD domain-containing protein [Actinomycetota bacterium]|nr:AzlD domain-containing protein [Actinomycetota bacterium]
MSLWATVLLAGAAAYLLKLAGHLVPQRWLEGPLLRRTTALLPVALLSALVVVQALVAHQRLVLDARAAGLAVAAMALLLRAPFVVVVVLAAATAALARHLGWAA